MLLTIIYALVPSAIIILIILGIFKNSNIARKGFWLLLCGVGFALLWIIGYLIDKERDIALIGSICYYLPIGLIAVVLFLTGIVMIIVGRKADLHVFNYASVSHNDSEQYLYLVYRYNGMFYLVKDGENFKGTIVKFYRGIYFYDDMMSEFVKANNLKIVDEHLIGTATKFKRNKKIIYNCFIVDLGDDEVLTDLCKFDPFTVAKANMEGNDKIIVMSILIGDKFNIEIK